MVTRRVRTNVLWSAMAVLGLVLGWPASSEARQPEPPHIDGSWRLTVTAVDPPLGELSSLLTLIPGGGVIESRRPYVPFTPFGPLLESGGHGAWTRTGGRGFAVQFMFLLQGAPDGPTPGQDLGTDNIRMQLRLSGPSHLTGTFRSQIKDPSDAVLFTVSGTVAGTRLEVTAPE